MITKKLLHKVYQTSCSTLSSNHRLLFIDTACRSSFHHTPDRPHFRRTYWANLQTHWEEIIPFDPELNYEVAIDTCVGKFFGAVLKAPATSITKRRPRDDPRPPIKTRIQNEIHLKNRKRRQWEITRDTALRTEVNRLQESVTHRIYEWTNDQWSVTLESVDPEEHSLWRMTKRGRFPNPSTLWSHQGNRSLTLRETRSP